MKTTTTEREISAIPTSYKGIQLKSRMEAQCAVLFDKLGWEWEYEKYSLMLPSGTTFIPDFWIPKLQMLVECRGYESARGNRQIEELGGLMISAGRAKTPQEWGQWIIQMGLPDGVQAREFMVVREGGSAIFSVAEEWELPAIVTHCTECGCWGIDAAPLEFNAHYCCAPAYKPRHLDRAYVISVSQGKVLVNGKPLEEARF